MIFLRSSHSIAVTAILLASGSSGALAADVSLDNLAFATKDGGTAVIRHVEFDGTNLSKDEVFDLSRAHRRRRPARRSSPSCKRRRS